MIKKSQIWIIVVVVIFVILLALFLLILFANKQGLFKSPDEKILKINQVFIKPEEGKSMNYALFSNDTYFTKGYLNSGDIVELNNIPIDNLNIYCWNDDTYPVNFSYIFSQEEITNNKAIITCSNNQIKGKVNLSYSGQILSRLSLINLNISVKDRLNDFKVCTSWSGGIISVNLRDQGLVCNQMNCMPIKLYNYTSSQYYYSSKCNSSWVNWDYYNFTTNKFSSLDKGKYKCGDWITNCEEVNDNLCSPDISIPQEYKNTQDKCFYFGKNLNNEDYIIPFIVNAMPALNSLDFLKFTLIDNSPYFDNSTNQFSYGTYNNGDIGIENPELIIKP